MDEIAELQNRLAQLREKQKADLRARNRQRRLAEQREIAAAKRAAGQTQAALDRVPEELVASRMFSGADCRSLTGMILGDPIPGDPRCPWRPSSGVYR